VTPPQGHKGFAKSILRFERRDIDMAGSRRDPSPARDSAMRAVERRAGHPQWRGAAGIRSPQVWSFTETEKGQH
jgi:hypothetical protein